ncbi:MAG: hypothetical protein IJR30_09170, partial [Prevotella sp.]|nr:hypothetical protein [Prevotella sp.]
MKRFITMAALVLAATMGLHAQKPMKAPKGGKAISDELIGIFFEDISSSADGGLFAELVQNGSFEFNATEHDGWGPATAWRVIRPGHSLGYVQPTIKSAPGIGYNSQTSMSIHAERVKEYYDYKGWKGFGLQNDGFDGIYLKAGQKYDFSVRMRNTGKGMDMTKQVRVALVEPQGWGKEPKLLCDALIDIPPFKMPADKDVKHTSAGWKTYTATLTPNAECRKAALQILLLTEGDICIDDVSLMPEDTY